MLPETKSGNKMQVNDGLLPVLLLKEGRHPYTHSCCSRGAIGYFKATLSFLPRHFVLSRSAGLPRDLIVILSQYQ